MIKKSALFCIIGTGLLLSSQAHALDTKQVAFKTQSNALLTSAASKKIPAEERESISTGAKVFIASMTDRGISFLSDPTMTNAHKRKEFENLLKSSFDIPTIGKYVLGRYWRTANEKQRQEYQLLFKRNIIDLYTNRFSQYSGQSIIISNHVPRGKSDTMVKSHIVPDDNSGPKIQLDWRVRYKNGEYRIIDIYIENVSMAITQRSDFNAVIQRGGGKLEVLLAHLEKD